MHIARSRLRGEELLGHPLNKIRNEAIASGRAAAFKLRKEPADRQLQK